MLTFLSGVTLGGSAHYHRGESWPLTLRLGAGVFLGSAADRRSGRFATTAGDAYEVLAREDPAASYFFVAPEVRVGRKFGKYFELSFGVEGMLMTALTQPKWADEEAVALTPDPLTEQGDGLGTFGEQSLAGSLLVVVLPGLAARYAF